jgi:5-methylcytosine-specific restriction endonuclease McrA
VKIHDPRYPTFDHFIPRSLGGKRTLDNGLLKHRRCNALRGNKDPTGCDRVWHQFVSARMKIRGDRALGLSGATPLLKKVLEIA